MTALFSKPDNSAAKRAQEAQLLEQRRQAERVREQELEEGVETGSRNRIINARLQTRGVPQLLNAAGGNRGTTLAG